MALEEIVQKGEFVARILPIFMILINDLIFYI